MIKSPESQIYALVVAVQFLLDHKAIEPAFELSTQMLAYCQEQTDSGRRWVHSRLLAPALHLPCLTVYLHSPRSDPCSCAAWTNSCCALR